MAQDEIPEPDRVEGAPHPRETQALFGHARAEAEFLAAFSSGRLHHGWLITGPLGVGKATLAWRIARFLLATPPADGLFAAPPPDSLAIDPDHPVARRVSALAEGRLFLLRRAWDEKAKRLKTQITVEEVRRMKAFFALSAADGGRRVAIVDPADEMNVSAANALLKLLEEPPEGVTILLVCHQPSRLLPTIRSRCRELRLAPLAPEDMARALAAAGVEADDPAALAELAGGSAGEAIRVANLEGVKLYRALVGLLSTLPRLDRAKLVALADAASGKGAEPQFELMLTLIDLFLARRGSGPISPSRSATARGAAGRSTLTLPPFSWIWCSGSTRRRLSSPEGKPDDLPNAPADRRQPLSPGFPRLRRRA